MLIFRAIGVCGCLCACGCVHVCVCKLTYIGVVLTKYSLGRLAGYSLLVCAGVSVG